MKQVFKYNLFKGLSIFTSCVPTILMAFSYGDVIVTDSGASISLAAIIGILIAVLCLKGKIAENFKIPSAFIVATVLFVIIILVENILLPAKFTCLTCMISCGIDELSFKRIYNNLEILMPEKSKVYKHFGFYFCKSEKLGEFTNVQN